MTTAPGREDEAHPTDRSDPPTLEEVRSDLASLADWEAVAYGSYLDPSTFTPRSDIDVAVITHQRDREVNRQTWRQVLGSAPDRYDLRVFELLPLDVQHDIAMEHEVVFGDPVEISFYFYRVHRLWDDVGPRIQANRFGSMEERLRLLGLG